MSIIDGGGVPDGAELRADVVVVGAGPSGIVVGLELADRGHDVLLVESGRAGYDRAAQGLGETAGSDSAHVPMELATRRRLGGASNLWGGRCVPFDPVDFERRPIAPEAGWPLSHEDLEAHLQRACEWCVCGDAVFDARRVPGLAERSLVPGLANAGLRSTALERWSLPTNFGKRYRQRLERSRRLRLLLGATCVEILPRGSGDGVERLLLRTVDGRSASARGARYVLAAGGLETTRLLFASGGELCPGGIGNHSGHLGRWYMAHVEARIARVRFSTPPEETIYGYERDPAGAYVRRRFTFSPELQRRRGLPNAALWLVNPPMADPAHGDPVLSLVYLLLRSRLGGRFVSEGIRQAHIGTDRPGRTSAHMRNVLRGLPAAARFGLAFAWGRYLRPGRKLPGFFVPSADNAYPLLYHGEHLPSRESHVRLSGEHDALGMPRLRTHLHFSQADVEGAIRAHRCLDEELREQGVGEVEYLYDDLEHAVRSQLFGGYHQAGTTRMSATPADGVVDRDLAVHGFDDLYVASSSVFASSSQANSTLTAIALAVRLADHLSDAS